jgi:hypothetical protein
MRYDGGFAEGKPHARPRLKPRPIPDRGASARAADLRPPQGRRVDARHRDFRRPQPPSYPADRARAAGSARLQSRRRLALLQIARLERALDLIGAQIDAGKPSAAHAFVRILDHLNRLAPARLRLKATHQRIGDEVETMEDRLGRLDAAREALAVRQAPPELRANSAKRNRPQVLDNMRNRETTDSAPPMISET